MHIKQETIKKIALTHPGIIFVFLLFTDPLYYYLAFTLPEYPLIIDPDNPLPYLSDAFSFIYTILIVGWMIVTIKFIENHSLFPLNIKHGLLKCCYVASILSVILFSYQMEPYLENIYQYVPLQDDGFSIYDLWVLVFGLILIILIPITFYPFWKISSIMLHAEMGQKPALWKITLLFFQFVFLLFFVFSIHKRLERISAGKTSTGGITSVFD